MSKKKNTNENFTNIVRHIPDYLTYALAALLLVDETIGRTTGFHLLKTPNTDFRIIIGVGLITAFTLNLTLKLNQIKDELRKIFGKYLGVVEVLGPYEELNFAELLEKTNTIKILTLSGTIAGQLGNTKVMEILEDESRKSKITLLLADPYSPAIITRYQSDEPSSYEAGIEGIKRRLVLLYKLKSKLNATASQKLEIKVYKNYPTISVVQADHELYSTVYGFQLRGGDCPKVHADAGGDYGKFLIKHFNKVHETAVGINEWYEQNKIDLEQVKLNN
jgi:hypothetical protein